MNTNNKTAPIRSYKVTCKASESIYTSSMIWASTGSEDSDRAAVTDTATRYAEQHGYTLVSVDEITAAEVKSNARRGMSYLPIDDKAKRDHATSCCTEPDPSEVGEATAEAVGQEIEPFSHLSALIRTASEERSADLRCYIANGYFPKWSNRDRENIDHDQGLKQYSTSLRWEQYQRGEIDRAKAVELATRRADREVAKQRESYFAKLQAAADTNPIRSLSIALTWHRSSVWGYNPIAEAVGDYRRTTGKASGCGYDKGSAAAADALNAQPQTLRFLYDRAEAALAEGADPHSKSACTGYCWSGILGYGSGYSVLPYYEGGVGMSSLLDLFTRGGYSVRSAASGRLYDCYLIDRAEIVTA